ncbi:UTP8 [Candida jiufengensis]|uniref:UTP8 n=1 Tax=Candida jiufengensis TaxID=497108 RepID=UPI0022248727|nr:UTP8 [Candida jiufengensis]KAI5953128.1 UTP8 [Candida jiufengensis]
MTTPSLSNQYPITTLPRVNGVSIENKLIIPQYSQNDSTTSSSSSVLDFVISKSMICSYLIKPTPKLIWSFALKPSVIVECIDVFRVDNKKIYLVGISERKTFKLILVETLIKQDNGITSYDTINSYEYKVDTEISGVKFSNENNFVVVYKNGIVEFINFKDEKFTKGFNLQTEGEIIYNNFINDLEDNLLLTVSQSKKELIYQILSVNQTKPIFEIQNHHSPLIENPIFAYISGNLYQYHDGLIDTLAVPSFTKTNTLSVSSIINKEEKVSIKSPAPDRLLLGNANKIYLLNLKFGAKLFEFKSVSSSSNPVEDKVFINQVIPVKGSSINTTTTTGFYINLKNKDNNLYLNTIDINVGLNKLNECLGKSISHEDEHKLNNIINIYDDNETPEDTELNEVYQSLKKAKEEHDLNKWESILIPYLKNNKSWKEIQTTKPKTTKEKVYQFKEFDVENDRIININFINLIFELIFTTTPILNFISIEFIPEYTLMYLLTSPIFPKKYSKNLLSLLYNTNNFTLLKQAIITCSNIPLSDLINQLIITPTEEKDIISDLITRLIEDFSTFEISTNFKSIIANQNTKLNIIEFVNKILSINNYNKWKLIEILIDINGLFNWTETNITKLNEILDSKIKVIDSNAYNLTLIDQINLKRNTAKKSQQKSSTGLLTITDQTKLNHKKLTNSELNKIDDEKIPVYSKETLHF